MKSHKYWSLGALFCMFSLFIERFVALSYSDAIVSDTVSISHSSDSEKT